jgi:hypothetical protein
VFISLEFPITFHKEPFKLYKILSFSVPINDTSRDATQIVDINDYFLISADEHYHVSLPRSTINQCVCISLMICPIRPLLKTMKEPDCEAVLLQNKKTEIHSKCNFRYFRNIDKPHILDLTATQLLIYQTKDLTLQCKEGTKRVLSAIFFKFKDSFSSFANNFDILCSYTLKDGILTLIGLLKEVFAKISVNCDSLTNCCKSAKLTGYKIEMSLVSFWHNLTC